MRMHPRERSYAELVRNSVPIAGRQNAYGDMQPDAENCSNGIAPQPNTAADSRKMTVPVVVSMTKFLFDHYRLSMYSYLNNTLRSGRLKSIVGFAFTNRIINREICTFRGVNYWRIDRLNFWADVSVSLMLSTDGGIREWRGYLCFWFSAEHPGPLTGAIEELLPMDNAPDRGGMTLLSPYLIPYFTSAKVDEEAENIWAMHINVKSLQRWLKEPERKISADFVVTVALIWRLPDWVSALLLDRAGIQIGENDRRQLALQYILKVL